MSRRLNVDLIYDDKMISLRRALHSNLAYVGKVTLFSVGVHDESRLRRVTGAVQLRRLTLKYLWHITPDLHTLRQGMNELEYWSSLTVFLRHHKDAQTRLLHFLLTGSTRLLDRCDYTTFNRTANVPADTSKPLRCGAALHGVRQALDVANI